MRKIRLSFMAGLTVLIFPFISKQIIPDNKYMIKLCLKLPQ